MLELIMDALIDTAKLIPFLLVTYLFMESLEHRISGKARETIEHAGKWGPLAGGVLGAVPQCGFSAAAASLYAGGVVSVGTLIAVFLSTSDEMIPVMISGRFSLSEMLLIVFSKVVIGVLFGLAADFVLGGIKNSITDMISRMSVNMSTASATEPIFCFLQYDIP